MKKFIPFLLLLVFLPIVSGITINEPRDKYTYYNNLIDFDITWDTELKTCKYNLNRQTNKTFGCENTFIIDIPYHSGTANITIYSINTTDDVNSADVNITISDPITATNGLVGLGVILFSLFVPLLLFGMVFAISHFESEEGEHTFIKMGFAFLALVMLLPAYNTINILIRQYIHLDILSDVLSPFVYTWITIIFIFYLFIFIIYKSFSLFFKNKRRTGDYE